MTASLNFSIATTPAALTALEPEWNPLLQQSDANGLFLTWEYISTWWEVFGGPSQLCVITARTDAGRLVGIAPLVLRAGYGWKRALLQHLTFLGGECETLAERQDFIVALGYEESFGTGCAERIFHHADLSWDVVRLSCARSGSRALAAFLQQCRRQGLAVREKEQPTWVAKFTGTWDDFLATRSSKFREMTRKKMRKLEQTHSVSLLHAGEAISMDDALLSIIRLNQGRWRSSASSFHTPQFIEFHRRLAPLLASRGWLSLHVLDIGGTIAAGRYDFIYAGAIWGFQSGWDRKFSELSVGHLALAYAIQSATSQCLTSFDFGAGPAPYKAQWGESGAPVLDIEITNGRRLAPRLFTFLHHLRSPKLAGQGDGAVVARGGGGEVGSISQLNRAVQRKLFYRLAAAP